MWKIVGDLIEDFLGKWVSLSRLERDCCDLGQTDTTCVSRILNSLPMTQHHTQSPRGRVLYQMSNHRY